MVQTTLETRRIAEELYALIQMIDPATRRSDLESAARDRVTRLRAAAARLAAQRLPDSELRQAVAHLSSVLAEVAGRRDWRFVFERLQPAYETVARRLRALDVDMPELRQTNARRSLVHVGFGLGSLSLLEVLALDWLHVQYLVSAFMTFAVVAETTRRIWPSVNDYFMRWMGGIAHPHEAHRVNSASWYTLALFLLAMGSAPRLACSLGVIILGLADPAAALVGRRFGTIKLHAGRSLQGTLTFFGVGFAAALAVLAVFYGDFALSSALILAAATAAVGAVTELYCPRWLDDNFAIPVAVGVTAALLLPLL